ncbi:MAG TPA: YjbH domain-containing protein, partial [Pseudomonadales bacterium]|nr:YjbH domain-containing protein [Pseudomonadales bacterium]
PSSPWSFGAEWEAYPGIKLTFSHQHGDEFGVGIRIFTNSSTPAPRYEPAPILSSQAMDPADLPEAYNTSVWFDMLLYDTARVGVPLKQGELNKDGTKATVVVANERYGYWPDAIEKAHQLAEAHMPASVTQVDYVVQENDMQVLTVSMPRTLLTSTNMPPKPVRGATIKPAILLEKPTHQTNDVTSKPVVDITLDQRVMLFDPDNPLAYQVYAKVGSYIRLPGGIDLKGAYAFDVMNNVEGMTRRSDSVLPHVRSDALLYLQQGKSGLAHLLLDKRGTLATDWHYRAYGGVLESMYSGVGGEILYSPFKSRLAFGASANWVKQRDYDRSFKHLDYSTTTAFVSAYWATPFNNYDLAVHAGRYLAKDVGATVELRRTFNNGWMVGLWATLTDVPFETFGEGSFDKGMFFRIPLDNIGDNGRSTYNSRIRPIQRDGGARLEGYSGNLWWDQREARYDVFKGGR